MTDTKSSSYSVTDAVGKLLKSQREFIFARENFSVAEGGFGCGKALSLDTPLPTLTGWITMGEVSIGDTLLDDKGKPCQVTFVTDVMFGHKCYRVTFDDGTSIIADAEHQWITQRSKHVKAQRVLRQRGIPNTGCLTTEQLAKSQFYLGGRVRGQIGKEALHSIPTTAIEGEEKQLSVDPYVLGVWLGDGTSVRPDVTCHDKDFEVLEHVKACGETVGVGRPCNGYSTEGTRVYYLGHRTVEQRKGVSRRAYPHSLHYRLRHLNLLGNKHIPRIYLRASIAQRKELLAGLLDTDGYIGSNRVEFCSTRKQLALDTLELARSLGLKASLKSAPAKLYGRITSTRYRVYFTASFDVFKLRRKLARQRTGVTSRAKSRWIREVVEVPSVPVRCIQVDSPSHLYLASEAFIATHNTYAGCLKGLILSVEIPGNRGIVGRYHGTDLADSTIPTFFEVCPPKWIRSYNKDRNIVTLRNGSEILFRHIHDDSAKKQGTKSRRLGANLGWFFIDQLEECTIDHWNTLVSRLRLPRAPKKFGFGAANPNGHDWIYQHWFQDQYREFKQGEFFQLCRSKNGLGIAVRSDENRISNGGFIEDDAFDNMRSQMPPEWIARYLDCSFEEFAGKIYRDYFMTSVHNIVPFDIPSDWASVFSIDVGGSAPWAIGNWRLDPNGNAIRTCGFHKPSVNSAEIASWIKSNVRIHDPRTLGVIDYENKLAMLELNQLLHCALRPAMKSVKPGIIQVGGMMHVNPLLPLPNWYMQTQSPDRIRRFEAGGSPQIFAFEVDSNLPWRRSMDSYVWDVDGKPKKVEDHEADETRYFVTSLPKGFTRKAPLTKLEARIAKLKKTDPASARESQHIDKHFRQRAAAQTPRGGFSELDRDDANETDSVDSEQDTAYDWGDSD